MTDAALGAPQAVLTRSRFYFVMALAMLAIAVVGFLPTYFLPLTQGAFVAPAIVHVHGAMFYAWTLYFVSQTWLVASGRVSAHREWGLLGVAIATAMVLLVFGTAGAMVSFRAQHGFYEPALKFTWVQVSGMLFFGAVVALAVMNVKRSEVHKRLMLLATISLMNAPIARWFLVLSGGEPPPVGAPPPVAITLQPDLITDLLLVAAMMFDWRTRGGPHPVYVIGGLALLAMQLTKVPVSETDAWRTIAVWLTSLGS
jgi:hypothetical protein